MSITLHNLLIRRIIAMRKLLLNDVQFEVLYDIIEDLVDDMIHDGNDYVYDTETYKMYRQLVSLNGGN